MNTNRTAAETARARYEDTTGATTPLYRIRDMQTHVLVAEGLTSWPDADDFIRRYQLDGGRITIPGTTIRLGRFQVERHDANHLVMMKAEYRAGYTSYPLISLSGVEQLAAEIAARAGNTEVVA